MMFVYILFVILILNLLITAYSASSESKSYCARFDNNYETSTTGGTLEGSFKMVIDDKNHIAEYTYYLNLSNFTVRDTNCDLSAGLTYHIHSNWENTDTSNLGSNDCGAAYTGFHFDPTFACSETSENHAFGTGYNTANCPAMNRTKELGYTYACSTTNYGNRDYSKCELGDLSGKLGAAMPLSNQIYSQKSALNDNIPVYNYNYGFTDKGTIPTTAYAWNSIVFHCKSTTNRLFCAKFQTITDNDNSCGRNPDHNNNDDDDDPSETVIIASTISIAFAIIGLYLLFVYKSVIYSFFFGSKLASNIEL